jgi:Mce-associated membrane protein
MTETLEAPIHLPAEDGVAHELADKSSAGKTSHSKETMRKKSATEGSEPSLATSAASAKGKAKGKGRPKGNGSVKGSGRSKENGSVLAAQEVEELSANSSTSESPVVEPRAIHSADHDELQPSPPAAESQQEVTKRRVPSWVAVRSWVGSNLLLSGLAFALVVAVVFLTLTQLSLNSENSLNGARTSAITAAKSYAADLATYNYKHLNQDFGKVLAESTPSFKQNFTQSSEALKTAIVKYDASASANVVGAGLVSATSSRAVVLVFLNQTVDNTIQKNKPTTESRVQITLVRSGGRWLIEQVSLL